jgi:hypothetical protein
MKTKLLSFLAVLLVVTPLRAATETAISALPAATTAVSDDAVTLFVKSGSTYAVQRMTLGNLSLSLTPTWANIAGKPITITAASGATLTLAADKTFTASNTLTLAGTDGSTLNIDRKSVV